MYGITRILVMSNRLTEIVAAQIERTQFSRQPPAASRQLPQTRTAISVVRD
jgi:hypothetical protein